MKHNSVKYGKLNIPYLTVQDIVSKSTRLVIIDHGGSGGTKQRFSRSGTATLLSRNGEKFIALCQHQLSDMGRPNSNDINMLRIVSEDKKFNAIPVERAFYLKNMKDEETADLLVLKANTEHRHWRAIDAPYFTPLTTRNNKTPEVTFAVGFPTEYSPFCDKEYQNLETSDFKSVNLTRECIPCEIDKNFHSDISFFHRCTITDKKRILMA